MAAWSKTAAIPSIPSGRVGPESTTPLMSVLSFSEKLPSIDSPSDRVQKPGAILAVILVVVEQALLDIGGRRLGNVMLNGSAYKPEGRHPQMRGWTNENEPDRF